MSTAPTPLKQQAKADGVKREKLQGRGHGLVATRDFLPRDQILFVHRPLVLALESSQLQGTCYGCLRSQDAQVSSAGSEPEDVELKTCTGCRTVRFCNKACQKHAWTAYHKYECKIFAKLQPRALPTTVRGIMRLLLQRKHGLVADEEWDQLAGLESHQEDLSSSGGDRWQDIFLMTKAIKTYSGTSESMDTIIRICCTMMVNSFTLTTPTFDPLGIVLHPLPALVNHSCDPNAIVRFDITSSHAPVPIPKVHHGSISVHALRPIAKGEEICITYIDATMGFERRQADLVSRYFFTCDCPICLLGPQHTSANEAAQSTISATTDILTSSASNPGALENHVPRLSQALSSLAAANALPLNAYPNAQLRHQLVLALIATQAFEAALKHNLILVFQIDPVLYPQPHHPSRLVSKWRLLRLTKYCLADAATASQATLLSMLACLLLDELAQTVLHDATTGSATNALGGTVRDVTDEDDDNEDILAQTTPPLGQFELMVYHALAGMSTGDAHAAWLDFRGRRDFWRREVTAWVDGVAGEVLRYESGGREAAVVST